MKNVKITAENCWAVKLWDELHDKFLDAQNTLVAVIRSRAWEPLGYDSFSDAWADKMSDVTIAAELRPHVVYAMFEEGCTPEQVAETVKGVGPKVACTLKEQKLSGVPAEQATTVVREHTRHKKTKSFVKFEIDTDTLRTWNRRAKRHHTSVPVVAKKATAEVLESWA